MNEVMVPAVEADHSPAGGPADEEGGGEPLTVRDRHLEEGLAELLVAGGSLTQSLLGAAAPRAGRDEPPD